jgi:lipid-binding SYLF domain-containing protein
MFKAMYRGLVGAGAGGEGVMVKRKREWRWAGGTLRVYSSIGEML